MVTYKGNARRKIRIYGDNRCTNEKSSRTKKRRIDYINDDRSKNKLSEYENEDSTDERELRHRITRKYLSKRNKSIQDTARLNRETTFERLTSINRTHQR